AVGDDTRVLVEEDSRIVAASRRRTPSLCLHPMKFDGNWRTCDRRLSATPARRQPTPVRWWTGVNIFDNGRGCGVPAPRYRVTCWCPDANGRFNSTPRYCGRYEMRNQTGSGKHQRSLACRAVY